MYIHTRTTRSTFTSTGSNSNSTLSHSIHTTGMQNRRGSSNQHTTPSSFKVTTKHHPKQMSLSTIPTTPTLFPRTPIHSKRKRMACMLECQDIALHLATSKVVAAVLASAALVSAKQVRALVHSPSISAPFPLYLCPLSRFSLLCPVSYARMCPMTQRRKRDDVAKDDVAKCDIEKDDIAPYNGHTWSSRSMERLVQRYMLCVCVLCVQIEHRVVGI